MLAHVQNLAPSGASAYCCSWATVECYELQATARRGGDDHREQSSHLPEDEMAPDHIFDSAVRPGISVQLVTGKLGMVLNVDHQRLSFL